MQEFSISPEYREQILAELDESVTAAIIEDAANEEDVSFLSAVQAWYDNLLDDLHDSVGDQEYQQGCLERMQVVARAFPGIIKPASEEDILREAPWAK